MTGGAGNFLRRVEGYCKRKRSYGSATRLFSWLSDKPFVSFTFDDFPRSAYIRGGEILRKQDLKGSFYASFGLAEKMSPSGEIFSPRELPGMIAEGHEIGSHTYDHADAWRTAGALFEESIIRNQKAIQEVIPGSDFRTFSYPLDEPHPRIKKIAARHFLCCRGGGQTFNGRVLDLNLLRSCFIDHRNRGNEGFFKDLIERNADERGWLIFSTHDIDDHPSDYGCEPEVFSEIVRRSVESGATILPVREVFSRLISLQVPS